MFPLIGPQVPCYGDDVSGRVELVDFAHEPGSRVTAVAAVAVPPAAVVVVGEAADGE